MPPRVPLAMGNGVLLQLPLGEGCRRQLQCRDPRADPVVPRAGAHRGDVGVVRHHEAADTVCGRQVWGLAGQSHLDAGGTPGDEVGQFPLSDPLQALVDLVGREQRVMAEQPGLGRARSGPV